MNKKQNQNNSMFLPLEYQPKYDWPENLFQTTTPLPKISNVVGFDIETKGLDPFSKDVFVISFAISSISGITYCNVVQHNELHGNVDLMQQLVEDFKIILIGHNIKFDLKWLAVKYGWSINCQVFDTMMASYLLNENEGAALDDCLPRYLGQPSYKGMVNTADLESEHIDDVLLYNALDAEAEVKLAKVVIPLLEEQGLLRLMVVANQVIPILTKMEARGICIDAEYAKKIEGKIIEDSIKDRIKLLESYGRFDPSSDKDIRRIIYSEMGFPITKKTASGLPSTDIEVLKDILYESSDPEQIDFIETLISYNKKLKYLTTYYQPIPKWLKYDGRRHPRFELGKYGAATGRLASDMQQMPRSKELRGMVVPTEGYSFIEGDFAQLELRVGAWLSQEPAMIDAFEKGWDIHTATMSQTTGIPYDELTEILDDSNHFKYEETKNIRVGNKNVNFGIFYGMEEHKLFWQIKMTTGLRWELGKCKQFINDWRASYPMATAWIQRQKDFIRQYGYARMPFSQMRRLPDAMLPKTKENWKLIARAERQGVNFIVQSTASWIMLIGMVLVDEYFRQNLELDGHTVLQVHDSGMWEVKIKDRYFEDENDILKLVASDIQNIMERQTVKFIKDYFDIDFNVPLKFPIKVLDRWE